MEAYHAKWVTLTLSLSLCAFECSFGYLYLCARLQAENSELKEKGGDGAMVAYHAKWVNPLSPEL